MGPPGLRRFLLDLTPIANVQRVKDIVDIMDRTSAEILADKKAALASGDEAVLKQVGQGKDLMSVLRAWFVLLGC